MAEAVVLGLRGFKELRGMLLDVSLELLELVADLLGDHCRGLGGLVVGLPVGAPSSGCGWRPVRPKLLQKM